MDSYFGKLLIPRATKASAHNPIFSFVNFIFDIAFINTPMLFNKSFLIIKFTKSHSETALFFLSGKSKIIS
jgi:hypothetical protein